ncbi:MAG: right-handed parallel beta-helix repeat-containing protein, partial [Candidatus Gracilibacteria bacterium]|nr:right-handed parallel beta-helix repeat-containing protein [Candidatus Gracilibacteria bacterium]
RNSLIENMYYDGISINSATAVPTIENSTIKDVRLNGIEVENSSVIINNNNITDTINDMDYGIYVSAGNPVITNNIIEKSKNDGIYIAGGVPSITGNTIRTNTYFGINSYNLDVRLVGQDTTLLNTITGNPSGKVVSRGNSFTPTIGTIDGSVNDILINGGGYFPAGKTLNINASSIIKMIGSNFFYVRGVLNVNGTSTGHVIFTSINENTIGSETSAGTGSPAWGNWYNIDINGTPTNGSIINYAEIRHANYGIGITNSNTIVRNSLIENMYYDGISINSATAVPTIENSTIKDVRLNGIEVENSNVIINNNNILNSDNGMDYGIYIGSGNPSIKNNIIKYGNTKGLYKVAGTPTISYNLLYGTNNIDAYNGTLTGTNIVGLDPLLNATTEQLSAGSPAINTGDTSFGNHPLSGNTYDIGRYEYTGYAPLVFTASISGVSGRNLTYEWSFTQDPTNGVNPPVINNSTGNFSTDRNISTSFEVTKLGNYTLKLTIKEGTTILGQSTNSFTIVNP